LADFRAGASRKQEKMAHDRFRMFGRCLILAAGLILLAPRGIAEAATDPVSASRVLYSPDGYPQLTLPDGRRETIRSMLAITRQMHFGEFVWDEKSVPLGPVWVRVDLARQLLPVGVGLPSAPPSYSTAPTASRRQPAASRSWRKIRTTIRAVIMRRCPSCCA